MPKGKCMQGRLTLLRQLSDSRENRAKIILQKGSPQVLNEFTSLVPSQFDSSKSYRVTHVDSYSCECEDHQRRCRDTGLYCKHIKAIILFQKVKTTYEAQEPNYLFDLNQGNLVTSQDLAKVWELVKLSRDYADDDAYGEHITLLNLVARTLDLGQQRVVWHRRYHAGARDKSPQRKSPQDILEENSFDIREIYREKMTSMS